MHNLKKGTSSCQGTLAMVMSDALDSPQYVTPFTSIKSGFPRDTSSAYCWISSVFQAFTNVNLYTVLCPYRVLQGHLKYLYIQTIIMYAFSPWACSPWVLRIHITPRVHVTIT